MATRNLLAFDFGASSGRAMLGTFDGEKLSMQQVHRFPNDPVKVQGTLYWDNLRLFHEIGTGLQKGRAAGGYQSVGIDTWGVDFGLIDKRGELLQNSVHYRDGRTEGMTELTFSIVPKEKVYGITGTQVLFFNTLFQMMALKARRPDVLSRAEGMLFMPDLFTYWLTGEKAAEYTIASTSAMLDAKTGDWAKGLLESLGLPTHLLPPVAECGSFAGQLLPAIAEELNVAPCRVVRVGSHDTASAVASVPTQDRDFLYISSGTWSLMGVEAEQPVLTPEMLRLNYTNEGGYGRTIRLLKNIMGLWLIQESRRQWRREGLELSFGEIDRLALEAAPLRTLVDPDDPSFATPGDMPGRIRDFARRTGQPEPKTPGEVARCIYESLALRYAQTRQSLCRVTGKDYPAIHIVGGGTQSKLLNRFTADAAGVPVVCGPVEATALGNLAVQLIAAGDLKDIWEARRVIAASFPTETYESGPSEDWQEAARRFGALSGQY